MKNLKIINGMNAGILLILAGTAWFLLIQSPPESATARLILYIVFALVMVCYLFYVIKVNLDYLHSEDENPMERLKNADKRGLFREEILTLEKSIRSIEFYRDKFHAEEISDGIREAYDLLSDKAYENIIQAAKWIEHYDYITNPSREYLHRLVGSSIEVTKKVNELDELMLTMNDSITDVDTTYVDDLLASLREVSKDE